MKVPFTACLHAALFCALIFEAAGLASAATPGPTDWTDWKKYRSQVHHPATTIQPSDLARAKRNIDRYPWAKSNFKGLRSSAEGILARLTPEYLSRMVERTTPGCVGPCPACRAKGLPWHPNGQWSWTEEDPDRLTCSVCETVFPNSVFPESIVLKSKWDPAQSFSFIGGETFRCFGYRNARPSLSGIIRAHKVQRVTSHLHTLALAYALTEEPRYAQGARAILLRFAEVLPKYLVRAGYGYGEYADMDPHVAAEHIDNLPEDELVYPPNKPDRKLYAGYWAASRIGSSGMDGGWVSTVAQAYDLTCTARRDGLPVYSDEERIRVERDVLLEGCYLAACDPAINNKSVGNRAGAAMVGMCVGHPGLVHFGLEGFRRTVEEWFLPDGGTSESAAYALMTMSGIRNFGLMFRDTSDPAGYLSPQGDRLDRFNACRDTRYGDCWQGLIWTLQGNLAYPPSADSYRTTRIGASMAELIAASYPTDEHRALLKESTGRRLSGGATQEALFYREPGFESQDAPPFSLPDVVFPYLSQGHLRTGTLGRDSLALLNASDYGGHHHLDSLDLYYWKDGHELLSDLGYLWDHPDAYQTRRTGAHNLVVIDSQDQRGRARGGSFHLFAATPRVKVMEASSAAYPVASVYHRTCIQVDHGQGKSYLVDVFRAAGGKKREYVFHGPTNHYEAEGLGLRSSAAEGDSQRSGRGDGPWKITWRLSGDYDFAALSPGREGETVSIRGGWGQRDHRNTDRGATLSYITRSSDASDPFVTVFAGGKRGNPPVVAVRRLPLPPGSPACAVALEVRTTAGADVIVSMLAPMAVQVRTALGELNTDGRVSVLLGAGSEAKAAAMVGGTTLLARDARLSCPAATYRGKIRGVGRERNDSFFRLDGDLPGQKNLIGQTLFVEKDSMRRGYPIRLVQQAQGETRLYTKLSSVGFEARNAENWEFVPSVAWERVPAKVK